MEKDRCIHWTIPNAQNRWIIYTHHDESSVFIECVNFSLTNKPGDLKRAQVNLLCIDKLVSGICSFCELEMEVRKSENYLTVHLLTNLKMEINQTFIQSDNGHSLSSRIRCGCHGSDSSKGPVITQAISDVIANTDSFNALWKWKTKGKKWSGVRAHCHSTVMSQEQVGIQGHAERR